VTGVTFWTFQSPSSYLGGAFTWEIIEDNGGAHGPTLGSGTFTLSQTLVQSFTLGGLPLEEYQNDFTIPALALNPLPQSYFLDIADTSGADTFGIFWARSGPDTLAFQLSGTGNQDPPADPTPEPGTLTMVACAATLGLWRRVRRSGSLH
jgi:hypothetical protein